MHTHPLRASNNGNGNGGEAATAAAIVRALSVSDISRVTATSTNTASLKSRMHDSISMLEETTKTLLRTMRFDLAFMASREEEARTVLEELESQYETIERDINTTTRHEGRVDEEGNAINNKIVSTIDWVDHHDHVNGEETNKQEVPPVTIPTASGDHAPNRQAQRSSSLRCSRVDWGSSPIGESFIALYGDESEHDEEVMDNQQQHRQWSLFGNKKTTTKQASEPTAIKKWVGWWRFPFFGGGSKCLGDTTDTTTTRTTDAPTPPPREEFPAAITSTAVPSQTTLPQYNVPGSDKESIGRASSTDNSGNFSDQVGDRQNEVMSSIRSDNLSALQLQLLGCDTAVSTLNQLLTCRERDQIDLQYERASLQHTVFYQEKYFALEIDQLRRKLHHGKVERRRKSRILEDAREELKTSIKMEEQLREELDCAQRELFMLKLQQDREEG